MSDKNKHVNLNWDDFQKMGNPDTVEEAPIPVEVKKSTWRNVDARVRVRIDKKGRGGKAVTVIDGLKLSRDEIKDLAKFLKSACGVGGGAKDGVILIQGKQRDKVVDMLKKEGFKDVKPSGG